MLLLLFRKGLRGRARVQRFRLYAHRRLGCRLRTGNRAHAVTSAVRAFARLRPRYENVRRRSPGKSRRSVRRRRHALRDRDLQRNLHHGPRRRRRMRSVEREDHVRFLCRVQGRQMRDGQFHAL